MTLLASHLPTSLIDFVHLNEMQHRRKRRKRRWSLAVQR
jgi:hypothetical protein